MTEKYDYLVIGSGPAGYTSAIIAAQNGLKTAVVERDPEMLGGVCLNEGCIPAKSLYNSAGIFDIALNNPGICGSDIRSASSCMAPFVKKSRDAANHLRQGLSFLFKKNGIDVILANAEFVEAKTVKLTSSTGGAKTVSAEKFLIAAGSSPRSFSGMPFDGKKVISSSHAIRLEKVPGNILIVGAGAIGVEFASFFNIMGAGVTLIEIEKRILPAEDSDVSGRLDAILQKRGIKILTSGKIENISLGDFDKVLIAAGRVPFTEGFGLEKAGIKTDEKGFIPVDDMMRTNIKNIYAAGDVVATPMLAHMASAEGELAALSAAGKDAPKIDYSSVPNAVYSHIQTASVGFTEEKAKAVGIDVSVGKQFFKSNGKAVVSSETEGFIKIVAEKATRKIVGVHILGVNATEIIHEFILAKRKGLTVDDISGTVHAHPTFSESAVDAARSVFERPVHG
jgi:dihydrolipoamide dehydrogenase